MHPVPPYPDQGLLVERHHPQPSPTPHHTHPDRGLIHILPALAFGLGGIAYPLYVLVDVFSTANADPETVPAAPFAAAVAAGLAFVAGVLIAGFVTMLGYTVVRLGQTRRTLVLQFVGLGVTLLGAVGGIALAFYIATI